MVSLATTLLTPLALAVEVYAELGKRSETRTEQSLST